MIDCARWPHRCLAPQARSIPSTWARESGPARGKLRLRCGAPYPLLIALALNASCQSGTASLDPPSPQPATDLRSKADEPNTTHGVYTLAQAARGSSVHEQICAECHDVADWTQPAFRDRWDEVSVYRLWHWIYGRMPHGNPGTLTRQQVTDALTYILQLNGLPPGDEELGTHDDTIDDYWIIWERP